MPRKPQGGRPLTGAERTRRARAKRADRVSAMADALHRIIAAETIQEAARIAAIAIDGE